MNVSNKAYENVLISGNHLASLLIGLGYIPKFPCDHDYEFVRSHHGLTAADAWVAWRAIMELREASSLEPQQTLKPLPSPQPINYPILRGIDP